MDKLESGNEPEEDSGSSKEEEEVDPRIQGELEKLNQSTDDINRWESELEDYRQRFRAVLVEATVKLDDQVKRIGRAVDESKPYWEARRLARQAQVEAQRAAQEFQRAVEILRAAKETIALAEERLLEEDSRQFDSAWQEMLNHATQRVMGAEQCRTRCEAEHKQTSSNYNACISHMTQLEKKLRRTINKSRPYFELKAKYYLQLEQLKRQVDERQAKLGGAKAAYRTALRCLETISEEIHARRRRHAHNMGARGRGVGAEGEGLEGEGDDIANFKMESDGLSMASVTFDDEANEHNAVSHTRSGSSPVGVPPHPRSSSSSSSSSSSPPPSLLSSPRPGGPGSPCGSAHASPLLGARSQCSGASSPDCDQERGDRAEGAEAKLEAGLSRLTLTTTPDAKDSGNDDLDPIDPRAAAIPEPPIPAPAILLLNSA